MKSISSDPRGAALAMWARGYSVYYIARALGVDESWTITAN